MTATTPRNRIRPTTEEYELVKKAASDTVATLTRELDHLRHDAKLHGYKVMAWAAGACAVGVLLGHFLP